MSLLKWTDFAQNTIIHSTISAIYVLIPYLIFDENDFCKHNYIYYYL